MVELFRIRREAKVTIQDLGSIGELLAALATIATLGYLAVQIRQNSESVRMGAEIELSKQLVDWHARVTSDPELIRIWDAAATNPESMNSEDVARLRWLSAECFLIYEGQYEFYKKGYIADEAWQPKMDTVRGMLKNPVISEWWEMRMSPFGDSFFEYVQSLRSQSGSWVLPYVGMKESDIRAGENAP